MLKFDQKLFDENTGWALAIARGLMLRRCKEVNRQFLPYQIEQAALVGLWQAVTRFDPKRGEFRSFARLRIMGSVQWEYRNIGLYDSRKKAPKVISIEDLGL